MTEITGYFGNLDAKMIKSSSDWKKIKKTFDD